MKSAHRQIVARCQPVVFGLGEHDHGFAAAADPLRTFGHRAGEDLGELVLRFGELPHDRLSILARLSRQYGWWPARQARASVPLPGHSIVGIEKARAFLDAGGPAGGDGLGAGVEAEGVGAVLVEVAEAGLLPAAEGVIGERHRDRHVDADHADVDPAGEVAGGVAVAGEDRGAVAVFVAHGQVDRLVVGLRPHGGEHGAEDLLLVDVHLGRDAVEEAGADEEAVLVALHPEAAAVDHELGALFDALVDEAEDAALGVRVTTGPKSTSLPAV
jgi:hypothetical protein